MPRVCPGGIPGEPGGCPGGNRGRARREPGAAQGEKEAPPEMPALTADVLQHYLGREEAGGLLAFRRRPAVSGGKPLSP